MLDMSILNNNLNNEVGYDQFFKAFGYTDDDTIYFRTFDDKNRGNTGTNSEIMLDRLDEIIPLMKERNANNRGVFFVVNGGGQSDKNVKTARAQFIDFDDYSFEEQIKHLNEFPLEPSIIVKARKSLHCYWLLQGGEIKFFREVQERLNQYFGSDPVIKNESRVMRLYGFNHQKTETPVMVKLIKFDPDLKYTQRQFHENLPLLVKKAGKSRSSKKTDAAKIPEGERHNYIVSRAGHLLNKIGDTEDDDTILSILRKDLFKNCENPENVDIDDFNSKYLKTIQTYRQQREEQIKDPLFFKKARKAWLAENPGKTFDPDVVSWEEVKEAGFRAGITEEEYNEENHDSGITDSANAAPWDDKQFYRINKNGVVTGVIDSAVVNYMKQNVEMFLYNDMLYIYDHGVYSIDEKGNCFKTMVSKLLRPEFVTATKLDNIFKLLKTDINLVVKESDLNNHPPYVINVKNGMLNLKTLELKEHNARLYRSINQIPHEYIPGFNYDGTVTEEFLTELFPDQDDAIMLLEYAGYCMTKDTSKQKFLIIKGPGATGKSELIHLVEGTIGPENTSALSIQNTNGRFDPVFLVGKLLNANADISSELMNDISGLKKLIGEDTMRAEYKGGKIFSFKPYVKLLFSANRIPESKDDKTNAYFRRMMILPVNKRCREIPKLSERLREETKNGVFFHMAVDAVRNMYLREGPILESKNSKAAVQQLYEATDSVIAFLKHRTIRDPEAKELRDSLFEDYKNYCYYEQRPPKTRNGFYQNLRDKGIEDGKVNGIWYFKGLKVIRSAKESLSNTAQSEEVPGEIVLFDAGSDDTAAGGVLQKCLNAFSDAVSVTSGEV